MKQEKINQNLAHFAKNETTALNKVRLLKRISKLGGWIILFVSFIFAFQEPEFISPWVYTAAAAFGGALIGLGMWFENTLLTWPSLRPFVDLEGLRKIDTISKVK